MTLQGRRRLASSLIVAALALGVSAQTALARSRDWGAVSDPHQPDEESATPALWRLLWTWPAAGTGTSRGRSRDNSSVVPILAMSLSRELEGENPDNHWIIEGDLGVFSEGEGVRGIVRLLIGPAFTLLDRRRPSGLGSTIALQTQGGVTFWSPEELTGEYHLADDGARFGVIGQVGFEGVRWTAPSSGWCARVGGTIESLFLRLPDDHETPPHPLQRWALAVHLDIGRAW
jgi:hypothetical protein